MPEEGFGKFERIDMVSEDSRLLRHRFLLSERPELREKLHLLRSCMEELQREYPEIVTLQIFGSHTKGYANETSDFDLMLPFDAAKRIEAKRTRRDVVTVLGQRIARTLGVDPDQVHIEYYEVNKPRGDQPRYEPFLLALGSAMRPYREGIICALELRPDGEERWREIVGQLWERENLYFDGQLMRERKKLYPLTLADARSYFLPESKNGS